MGRKKSPISAIAPSGDEWMEIEVTVDSGACDTVMPADVCQGISVVQSVSSHGAEYEVANGHAFLDEGQNDAS